MKISLTASAAKYNEDVNNLLAHGKV